MTSESSTPTSVGTGTNFDKKIWEDTINLIKNENLDITLPIRPGNPNDEGKIHRW